MPTPDPIALPELPACHTFQHPERFYTADQMRSYGQACVDALTPAPLVPEGMVLVPREATEEMARAGAQDVSCLSRFGAKVCYEAMIAAAPSTPPLNEPFGNAEQLASLEQRAREDELPPGFVWLTASAAHLSDAAANIRQLAEDVGAYDEPAGIVPAPNQARLLADIADALEADALFHRTAALSAQPRELVDASANGDSDISLAVRHNLFVYEVDFGEEGKGRYIRLDDFNKVVAEHELAAPQPREVRGVDGWSRADIADLRDRLISSGISKCMEGTSKKASDYQFIRAAIAEASSLLESLLATTPQDAAGVTGVGLLNETERSALSALLANLYHEAEDVEDSAPSVEDNEDAYWAYQQWHAITKLLGMEKIHTTPPPGVDVGKLRELVVQWRLAEDKATTDSTNATEDRDAYAYDYEREAYKNCADELTAAIDAAAPGVQS